MLEHRKVVNFFVAMDEVIDHDPPGVWLAVTSLSFDISVLELLWTLTRGFHVVLKADERLRLPAPSRPVDAGATDPAGRRSASSTSPPARSRPRDGYRLLLESARFADATASRRCGRPSATSTPSAAPTRTRASPAPRWPRSPSTSGSAPAASCCRCTRRSASPRSGRSSTTSRGGRVGISFAAGWQPNDFVLNPGAYATAKDGAARN